MSTFGNTSGTSSDGHKCLAANPLQTGGTSQRSRLLNELLPGYAQVDERSMKDLAKFVFELATEFAYYDETNTSGPGENWQAFFDLANGDWDNFDFEAFVADLKATQEAEPHVALFLAFLYMFRHAQFDLNTLTKRHLDFYYRDVLRFEEQAPVPDQVALVFELAKQIDNALVRKGTELKGGKDQLGVERIYTVDRDTVISKASVGSIKSLFVNLHNVNSGLSPYPENDHRIYASSVSDSEDGIGAEIASQQGDWRTFGAPEFPALTSGGTAALLADRPYGEIGFAVSSPILFLAEGQRTITLECDLRSGISHSLSGAFKAFLSGEEEWIEAEILSVSTPGNSLNIVLSVAQDLPAIVRYDQEVLEQPLPAAYPVLKCILNQERSGSPFTYEFLKNIKIREMQITVDVDGVRDLVLENDAAALDPAKPFFPFGTRPVIGSQFYVGSWEVFQKELSRVQLAFRWKGLAENESLGSYYHSYHDYDPDNTDFQVGIDMLNDRAWTDLDDNKPLFTDGSGTGISDGTAPSTIPESRMDVVNTAALSALGRDADMGAVVGYSTDAQRGFLRLSLQNIDFGHAKYPNSFAQQAIALSNQSSDLNAITTATQITAVEVAPAEESTGSILLAGYHDFLATKPTPRLPNAPYTPQWEEFSLNYSASVTITLEQHADEQIDTYQHIEPFGTVPLDPADVSNQLLPLFTAEGHLYIGLENLAPPQTLSMLIQVAEGSANPDLPRQNVEWHYLSDNTWKLLDPRYNVLIDETNGLLTSGLMLFDLPADMNSDNMRMPATYGWIRATVTEHSDAISRLISVHAQAIPATFNDRGNDPEHLENPLEAGTIKKLVRSNAHIQKIDQPYASYDGKMEEESSAFYTRVSERLRHKHRAITIWDYEHLALQKFPALYKVKTVNHNRFTGTYTDYSELAPGHVTVLAIPDLKNQNAVDKLKPKTSLNTLAEIHDYLAGIGAPCTQLHVHNPIYEEIRVDFEVKFHSGVDAGLFASRLQEEIQEFLAPWAFDCKPDIAFGGRIHKSMLINFVEERPYVDYVTCFKMFHLIPGDASSGHKDIDEACASTAVAILGSSDNHAIAIIDAATEECTCPDNEIPSITQIRARTSSCTG